MGKIILTISILFISTFTLFSEQTEADKTAAKSNHLLPVVQEFKNLIESDSEIYMLFSKMFEQLPKKAPFTIDPTGAPQVQNYTQMLKRINQAIRQAPTFNKTGVVGFPINAILNWPMGTKAGTKVFLNSKVNHQFKKVLNEWTVFLKSSNSRYVLNDDPHTGWFGKDAKEAMPTFVRDFKCNPKLPYHGFSSWDNFFTREFRRGIRPVASPENDAVICNACESAPYKIATNIKKRDKFWIKGQPYSLSHMMDNDPFVEQNLLEEPSFRRF